MTFSGDVLFFKNEDSFVSKLIAKLTKSEFSHVGLIIDYDKNTDIATIIEANRFIKTRKIKVKLNDKKHAIYTTPKPKTDEQIIDILEMAHEEIGTSYDYRQILTLFISLVFKKDRKDMFNNTNKMICSELIDWVYIYAGIERNNLSDVANVTPQELIEKYSLIRRNNSEL